MLPAYQKMLPPIKKHTSFTNQESVFSSTLDNIDLSTLRAFDTRSLYEKTAELRSKLPVLRKQDIAKFRNTYHHNLCLDMLTGGFHMSFCELMNLIRQQADQRLAEGPDSNLWSLPQLNTQPEKLDQLRLYLIRAESAGRHGRTEAEYKARFQLAQFFMDNPHDQWLMEHFFTTCLEVALKEGSQTQLLAEGYCNVGLCYQKNKNHKEAVKLFEAYHKLAKENKDWCMLNGTNYYIDSCVKLYHIYTTFGLELGKSGEEEDSKASLQMLKQALEMAKNSGDYKLEGEASYALGMAYQKANELDIAHTLLTKFYESCKDDSNNEGIGRACDAIAKLYARQGNKEKSVEFLKRFVELTEKTGLEREYCMACQNLGNVCNSVGNYNEATEYFSKAYNISRALGDPASTNTNRVHYGIAMAHRIVGKFANHIVLGDIPVCMARLLDWKSLRIDTFHEAIPDTNPGAAFHVIIPPSPEPARASTAKMEAVTSESEEIPAKEEGEQ